jgi:Xaa-Pro aminopeptidase
VVARSDVFEVRAWSETEDPVQIVARLADAPARIAIADHTWSVFLLGLQQAMPGTVFTSARPLSAALRLRKDAEEIALMRAAAAAVDRVAVRLAGHRFSGKTERHVSREVAAMTVEEGCDLSMFAIVASGPNGASPHHEPTERVIETGDAVVVDFGGPIGGYQSDTTRTFHVGEPSAEYRKVYEAVRLAQAAGVEAARAGVAAEAVDAAARGVIDDAGYGEWFIHRLGHGIGLDVHEDPYLVEGNAAALEPGMTFSVEPGIYLPGRFGVRIEDIVVCTAEGPERLNRSPRQLTVVA